MEGLINKKFSIGDVVVNPQTNEIIVGGKEKRLEPKLIALLVHLAQHAQQVVTRQQITETIWPNVIVGEESITQAIFVLRNALGDDAKKPKYIETIPKKGYRFLADVSIVLPKDKPFVTSSSRLFPWRLARIVVGLALLGIVALFWQMRTTSSYYEMAKILPVTKMSGAECCMAINNSHKMAFINVIDNVTDIYVKDLTSGTQERITQDSWQKGPPSWLDDNTLIYPRCSSSECQIVKQHVQQSPQTIYSTVNYIGEVELTPHNPNIFIFNEQNRDGSEFTSFDLRSGKYEKLRERYTDLPRSIYHPVFSDDGKQLYFVNFDPKSTLMALDLATQKIQLINDQFDDIKSFSFDHHQQFIVAGVKNSTTGIWLLDKAGAQPRLLVRSVGNEQFLFPLVGPNEQTIYYQNAQGNQDIGMLSNEQNIASGEKKITDDIVELNSTGIESEAILSSDEQFIYFVSDRSGFSEVWRYDVTKKKTIPITHLKTTQIKRILLSHDGQRFSALYLNDTQAMLGVFSAHTGELLASIKSESYPLNWSHDDNYLYVQDHSKDIPVLMRYDSQTLHGIEIQKNAGLLAQDSEDNKSIIFVDFEKNALVSRDNTTGIDQALINMDVNVKELLPSQLRLNSAGTSLLVIKQQQDIHQLWQYPFNVQNIAPTKLMDLPKQAQVTFINGKGNKVLFEKQMPSTGDIMKIELK